jgi:hypothetical protein
MHNYGHSTVNFKVRGAGPGANMLTSVIPYLNAFIQGADRAYRAHFEDSTRLYTWLKDLFGLGAIAVVIALMNHDDEDYRALSAYQRDRYWNIKIPGTHNFYKIPKPQEIGPLFGSAFERAVVAVASGEYEGSFEGWRESVLESFIPGTGTAFRPLLDAARNRTWYGGDLVSDYDEKFRANNFNEVYDESTSAWGKTLAKGLPNIKGLGALNTPIGIDYVTSQMGGFVGKGIVNATANNEWDWFDAVFARAYVDAAKSNRYTGDVYDMKNDYTDKAKTAADKLEADPKYKFTAEEKSDYRNNQFLNRVTDKDGYKGSNDKSATKVIPMGIAGYTAEINRVAASDMPKDKKEKELERLRLEKMRLAKTAILIVEHGNPTEKYFKTKDDLKYARKLYTFAYMTAKQTPDDKQTSSAAAAPKKAYWQLD